MDSKVRKVKCGGGHTGLLSEEGDLYLMGRGRDGQIGRGDQLESVAQHHMTPARVDYFRTHNL
jgi:alpha-tubulin suppressor-like RCC1 family protein